jgi:hypothetical protein
MLFDLLMMVFLLIGGLSLRRLGQRQRATPAIRHWELARANNSQREHLSAES